MIGLYRFSSAICYPSSSLSVFPAIWSLSLDLISVLIVFLANSSLDCISSSSCSFLDWRFINSCCFLICSILFCFYMLGRFIFSFSSFFLFNCWFLRIVGFCGSAEFISPLLFWIFSGPFNIYSYKGKFRYSWPSWALQPCCFKVTVNQWFYFTHCQIYTVHLFTEDRIVCFPTFSLSYFRNVIQVIQT